MRCSVNLCTLAGFDLWFRRARPPATLTCWRRFTLPDGGVDFGNFRMLRRASNQAGGETIVSLALLNARSLENETFILNDFFTSRELDFMFLTETWIQIGESIQFSELLLTAPPDPRAEVEG